MNVQERRVCRRFTLNHPVMIQAGKEAVHLAEILDAGIDGLRIRLTDQSGFKVGHDVDIACLPSTKHSGAFKHRCQVAWEDSENLEVGLKYLQ